MSTTATHISDWTKPADPAQDQRRRARTISVFALAAVPFWLYFALRNAFFPIDERAATIAVVLLAGGVLMAALPLLLRRGVSVEIAGNAVAAVQFVAISVIASLIGGFPVRVLIWNAIIPLSALLIARTRTALLWCGLVFVQLVVLNLTARTGVGEATLTLLSMELESLSALVAATLVLLLTSDRIRRSTIEENRLLSLRLEQSHRLESLGEVAGAISHDFNNMLTIVQSYAGMLLQDLPEDAEMARDASEILTAAERGAELTHALRTFARNEPVDNEPLDINQVIRDLEPLLRSLVGEPIRVRLHLRPDLRAVVADRGQLERVLVNLALNARDAMADGGTLDITTSPLDEAAESTELMELKPGPHLRISFSDTGVGMPAEVIERVFEPFFTTKDRHRGTGLGLSTAYGIVRAAGGRLLVRSRLGVGSTFEVVLPACRATPPQSPAVASKTSQEQGGETILVVDDQVALARATARMLAREGYKTAWAGSCDNAMDLFEEQAGQIDLVLTDVVMPDAGGAELAAKLKARNPGLRVLFMSGYTGEMVPPEVRRNQAVCLPKPFTRERLLTEVRRALRRP